MTKFIGPAYECFYVPDGKTACFNSIGELETEDKEVIAVLSYVSNEGTYGVSIVKDKEDVSEPKTSLEVNESDETITKEPTVEVTETVITTEEVTIENTEVDTTKVDEQSTDEVKVLDEKKPTEEVAPLITEEVTDTATLTEGVKKGKAK